jgi:alkylation response protein AidB-like acyl-CoA dehydrogenase
MQVTTLSDEQQALREVCREVLEKESAPSQVRALTEAHEAYDPKLWRIAGELGWFGLEVPESLGGSGQGFYETALVLRELGRATTPGPYLSHLLAVAALNEVVDHPFAADKIGELAAGETVGAVLLGEMNRNGMAATSIRAERQGSGWVLDGTQDNVPDVGLADVVIVVASSDDGAVVVALEGSAGLTARWRKTHDRTHRLFDVDLQHVEVAAERVLATGERASELIDTLWYRAATGVALDGVGGAGKVLEMTVSYTSQRVQYGRVIATFQAVKHTCADMFVESEVARIAADAAALEIAARSDARRYWSAVAKFRACDAYSKAAGDALQMHGGIGMTWEFDLHYWLKRAKLNTALYGSSDAYRAVVSRIV